MKHRNLVMSLACAAVLLGAASGARAQVVSHLNAVSDKSEDVSSPEAWKKAYIKDGMSDQDKAIAVFNTMVRYRHQAAPPQEQLQLGCVHDPLKTIHVYGYGMCCCASGDVSGLVRYLGYEARGRIISAHSVPEMKYNDAWHLIDCSVMNYHINERGELASVGRYPQRRHGLVGKAPRSGQQRCQAPRFRAERRMEERPGASGAWTPCRRILW